jgi:hypothetical protein
VDLSGAVNNRRSENNKGLHCNPFLLKKRAWWDSLIRKFWLQSRQDLSVNEDGDGFSFRW